MSIDKYYKDWKYAVEELQNENPRSVAIVGAALMDGCLRSALNRHFLDEMSEGETKELFEQPTAPLQSFYSKIRMCYALGLLGKESKLDLEKIGTIRNKFAHYLDIQDFDHPKILPLCQQLKAADTLWFGQSKPPSTPKDRFIQAVIIVGHFLYSELVAGTGIGKKADKSP